MPVTLFKVSTPGLQPCVSVLRYYIHTVLISFPVFNFRRLAPSVNMCSQGEKQTNKVSNERKTNKISSSRIKLDGTVLCQSCKLNEVISFDNYVHSHIRHQVCDSVSTYQ